MPGDLFIRPATAADAAELLVIYAPYVAETAISFEYAVPTGDEFVSRIAAISEKYPYLAAVKGGDIVGYAYAACFKPRAAYDRSGRRRSSAAAHRCCISTVTAATC